MNAKRISNESKKIWAKTCSITNRGKFKTSFESYSLSLASFVCWSKLYHSSFILVIWLFKLNMMKLGQIGLNWAKTDLCTIRVKFLNVLRFTH